MNVIEKKSLKRKKKKSLRSKSEKTKILEVN